MLHLLSHDHQFCKQYLQPFLFEIDEYDPNLEATQPFSLSTLQTSIIQPIGFVAVTLVSKTSQRLEKEL